MLYSRRQRARLHSTQFWAPNDLVEHWKERSRAQQLKKDRITAVARCLSEQRFDGDVKPQLSVWQVHFRASFSPRLKLLSRWALGTAPRALQPLELFAFETVRDDDKAAHATTRCAHYIEPILRGGLF